MEPMVVLYCWCLCTQVVITSLDIDDKIMIIGSHVQSKASPHILYPFHQLTFLFWSDTIEELLYNLARVGRPAECSIVVVFISRTVENCQIDMASLLGLNWLCAFSLEAPSVEFIL